MATATKSPIDQARELLSLDDPSYYDDADEVAEGIVSEIEYDRELTAEEIDEIDDVCQTWWNSADHDEDDDDDT